MLSFFPVNDKSIPIAYIHNKKYDNVVYLSSEEDKQLGHTLNDLDDDDYIDPNVNYDDDTFELKRWPPGDDTTWFTYPPDALKTMFKHINLIDYVICPKLIRHKDIYEVGFHMIADAKSFRSYLSPSKYVHPVYKDRKSVYYNHFFAMNDGNCVYNNNIKYRS